MPKSGVDTDIYYGNVGYILLTTQYGVNVNGYYQIDLRAQNVSHQHPIRVVEAGTITLAPRPVHLGLELPSSGLLSMPTEGGVVYLERLILYL